MSSREVRKRLQALGTPERSAGTQRFFKTGPGEYGEGDRFVGVTVPEQRKLAREFRAMSLADLTTLLTSPWHEERAVALMVMVLQYPRADEKTRSGLHELYLANTKHINNWDLVDLSAHYVVGAHLPKGKRALLKKLAKSKSLWERRIAIIATFIYIRENEFSDTLEIAEILLDDKEDLIHKAVGWMLREVGNRDREAEEAFLRKHAKRMPRTMLRYAIEKFPEPLRVRYMAR